MSERFLKIEFGDNDFTMADSGERDALRDATLRDALETALKQWEVYADSERSVDEFARLAEGNDTEAQIYRQCKAALSQAEPAPAGEALEIAISLLEETRTLHRDPDSDEYNKCETAECHYCELAAIAIKGLQEGKG